MVAEASFPFSALDGHELFPLGALDFARAYHEGGYLDDAHQPAIDGGLAEPKPETAICVMSYSGCYGDLCGKCLLALMGWKQEHVNVEAA